MKPSKDANFLRELATLIEAGLPPATAMQKLKSHGRNWIKVEAELNKGSKLGRSLYKYGFISRYEQEVVSIAEDAGRLPDGLRTIAESSEKRAARIRHLKSKLFYPFSILTVAIGVNALVLLIGQSGRSTLDILINAALQFIVAFFITRQLLKQLDKDACTLLSQAWSMRSQTWYQLLTETTVFGVLYWQQQSGISFQEGFKRTARLIDHKAFKKQLSLLSNKCAQGHSVSDSLNQSELPVTDQFKQILLTAEQSGNWSIALSRQLSLSQEELHRTVDVLFAWLPRIFYLFVVIIAANVIL
jgi:type II secretory pathway component PulF